MTLVCARRLIASVAGRESSGSGYFLLEVSCFRIVDPSVLAPVLSQSSLPTLDHENAQICFGSLAERSGSCERSGSSRVKVLGLGFTEDWVCPAEKGDPLRTWQRIRRDRDRFVSRETHTTSLENAHGLVSDFIVDRNGHPTQEAFDRVIAFFGASCCLSCRR
jgi:hypothetical protein